jgi:hypothetical protein
MFEMVSVESHHNVADLITKVLGKELHEKHLNSIMKDLKITDSEGVSKNDSVKISGKEKESDSMTAIRSADVTKPDDITRECSGMVRFKE